LVCAGLVAGVIGATGGPAAAPLPPRRRRARRRPLTVSRSPGCSRAVSVDYTLRLVYYVH